MGIFTYTRETGREIKGDKLNIVHWATKRGVSVTAYNLFDFARKNLSMSLEDLYKAVQEEYKKMGPRKARLRIDYNPALKYFEVSPSSKIFSTFIVKENER